MDFGSIAIVLVVLFIALFIIFGVTGMGKEKDYNSKIPQILEDENITGETFITDGDLATERRVLSISEDESSVIIVDLPNAFDFESGNKKPKATRLKFDDIIEVKIKSNSSTVTSTSRGSQLGGAVVGGALFGGAGAVIGGLSGKTKSNESIRKLTLEIVVNNISNPIVEIDFFKSKYSELKAGTMKYDELSEKINLWYRKFTVILHQQDQKQKQAQS